MNARWSMMILAVALTSASLAQGQTQATAEVAEEGRFTVLPLALPAYQPETSLLLGAVTSFVYDPPKGSGFKSSQVLLAGVVTVKKQYSLLVQPEWYFLEDRLQLAAMVSVARFPNQFFGIGPDTAASSVEAYTPVQYEADLSPKWRIFSRLYLGPSFRFQHVEMLEVAPEGRLATSRVPGSNGGRTVQLGAALLWDSRNSTLYPTRGSFISGAFRTATEGLGSEYTFNLFRLDARRYFTLPWRGHILALQGLMELRSGEPPFYDTGRVGGDNGRGYFEGRFRDRQLLSAQAEYRARLFWRIGGVAFASVATVAPALDKLNLKTLRPGGGLGLRFQPVPDVPLNVRLDVAYGDGMAFYFNIGEAF